MYRYVPNVINIPFSEAAIGNDQVFWVPYAATASYSKVVDPREAETTWLSACPCV